MSPIAISPVFIYFVSLLRVGFRTHRIYEVVRMHIPGSCIHLHVYRILGVVAFLRFLVDPSKQAARSELARDFLVLRYMRQSTLVCIYGMASKTYAITPKEITIHA